MSLHPQAKQAFQEGLESTLRQWTALELAVVNQWGGASSAEKASQLYSDILNMFINANEKVYKDVSVNTVITTFTSLCKSMQLKNVHTHTHAI